MVKARSLKHVRYVISGVTPDEAILPNRKHYWCKSKDAVGVGNWSEDLGHAEIFQDYADARGFHKMLATKYPDLVETINLKVEIVSAKTAMIAKLRTGAENE